MRDDIEHVIQHALEASVYVRPREPGLLADEIRLVAARAGFMRGQIEDYINDLARGSSGSKFLPNDPMWEAGFPSLFEPDYRNPHAFEFVRQHLKSVAAERGQEKAFATRQALLALGTARGLSTLDIDVAIQLLTVNNVLRAEGETVFHTKQNEILVMPLSPNSGPKPYERPRLREAYELVHAILNPDDANKAVTVRRRLLRAIYDKYMESPTAQIGWDRDNADEESAIRIREARWLHEHGLIAATFGAVGDFMARLTVKGRDFVDGGEIGFRVNQSEGASLAEGWPAIAAVEKVSATAPTKKPGEKDNMIKLFVSHAAKDASLAKALVDCVESSLVVPDRTVRCTSVPGYKLEAGDVSDERLRDDIEGCDVVLGILTESSLQSGYVMMELGAAWAFRRTTCAVLSPNLDFNRMPGPTSRLHAIKAESDHDIAQMMETLSAKTGWSLRNTARVTSAVNAFVAATKLSEGPPADGGSRLPASGTYRVIRTKTGKLAEVVQITLVGQTMEVRSDSDGWTSRGTLSANRYYGRFKYDRGDGPGDRGIHDMMWDGQRFEGSFRFDSGVPMGDDLAWRPEVSAAVTR